MSSPGPTAQSTVVSSVRRVASGVPACRVIVSRTSVKCGAGFAENWPTISAAGYTVSVASEKEKSMITEGVNEILGDIGSHLADVNKTLEQIRDLLDNWLPALADLAVVPKPPPKS